MCYSIGDVDSIPSVLQTTSKTRRKRGRLCQSNVRHKSLTPAGSSTTQELVRFRIPDENPESFPFSQFGWRRIKLLGFLLCHCSTLTGTLPLNSQVTEGRDAADMTGYCSSRTGRRAAEYRRFIQRDARGTSSRIDRALRRLLTQMSLPSICSSGY